MAQTFYSQNIVMLKHIMRVNYPERVKSDEGYYNSYYIGSYLYLDPCGKYHHVISPNGVTQRCINYWKSLDKAANKLGGWIESSEGDPLDTYFCVSTKG